MFLVTSILPVIFGYIFLNDTPPPPRLDMEKFQLDKEQLFDDMKRYNEALKSLKEDQQQDEAIEEIEIQQN